MLVQIEEQGGSTMAIKFESSFRIGRDARCELRLESPYVSRIHAHVTIENGHWWITDLASSNGTFCQGQPIDRQQLESGHRYYLSKKGPRLTFFDLEVREEHWRVSLGHKTPHHAHESSGTVTKTSILPKGESDFGDSDSEL